MNGDVTDGVMPVLSGANMVTESFEPYSTGRQEGYVVVNDEDRGHDVFSLCGSRCACARLGCFSGGRPVAVGNVKQKQAPSLDVGSTQIC